jgi:enoyl-CoA hydratase/carnithine racemase
VVRDLLLTGRSFNAAKALDAGIVSQLVSEGQALRAARATAAQIKKFDRETSTAAKRFIKPIPYEELQGEIEIFCRLMTRPAVEEGLRRFVESADAQPYLP